MVPLNLKHKPVYAIQDDYRKIDGVYKNDTDVEGISIGRAQWANTGDFIASAKVWRRKNDRWSRQSEETTLTRALDLAALVIKVAGAVEHDKNPEPIITLQGTISIDDVCPSAGIKNELIKYFRRTDVRSDIKAHIDLLSDAIEEYKKQI